MNELKDQKYLAGARVPAAQIEKNRPVLRYLAEANLWLLLWLVIFGLTFAWRIQNLAAFGLSNDEGVYLMWGRLAAEGYSLYSQTRAVQPPLFLEAVGWAFRLGGVSVQTGRWAILISYVPLAVALSWLAYRSRGRLSALVAMLLLGLAPLIFTFSRLVMAEVPATGLAIISLVLLFLFVEGKGRIWLIASGICFGVSLVTKALNPFVVVPVGLLLVLTRFPRLASNRGWRRIIYPLFKGVLADAVRWSAAALMPLVIVFLMYDSAAFYQQVIAFRNDLRAAIPGSWLETRIHFELFLKTHWGFWLLAFGGIMAALVRVRLGSFISGPGQRDKAGVSRPLYTVVWFVWLLAGVVMLAWHTPLFAHHFVVLLPPLILLGADFVADLFALWRFDIGAWYVKIGLSLLMVGAALNLPAVVEANQETAAIVTGGREAAAMSLLRAVSAPDDFVMGDSQLLIFMADRRTPPPLGDVALVAIKAGRQTSERMIALTRDYRSPAVVQWSLRLPWLPEYLAWVEDNYLARRVWDNDHIIYFGPRFLSGQAVPNEKRVPLGDKVIFHGHELVSGPFPGQATPDGLQLKVYWQTREPLDEDYTIFTQLLDSNGTRVAGWDSQPLGGYLPTSQWPAGEIVTDIVQLPLPDDLPADSYTVITGMYTLDTLERLLTPAGHDHIVLTPLRIE